MDIAVSTRGNKEGFLVGTHGTTFGELRQQVNPVQMLALMHMARRNALVRSVIEKLVADVVDCRLTMRLRYGNEFVALPESEQQLIGTRWKAFAREALWYTQVLGFFVVEPDTKTRTPRIVPPEFVRIMFREGPHKTRTYWAEDPAGKVHQARIFIKYPPDLHGFCTSPASVVLPSVERYDSILANQDYGDFNRTHLPWVIQTNGTMGRPDVDETDRFFEGEVASRYDEYHRSVISREVDDFNDVQKRATESYEKMVAHTGQTQRLPAGARIPPYFNNFVVPPNQAVTTPPMPSLNPHFEAELLQVEATVLRAFGVPPMIMGTTHATRFASQPELAMKQWTHTVRSTKSELEQMLSNTYMFVAHETFSEYSQMIVDRFKLKRVAAVAELLRHSARKRSRKSQRIEEKNNELTKEREQEEKKEEEEEDQQEGDYFGGAPVVNEEGELQLPETPDSLKRAAIILSVSDMDIIMLIQKKFSAVFELHLHPSARIEDLDKLYKEGLISRDTYAVKAADLMGMPPEQFLIGIEAQKEDAMERRELAEILAPSQGKSKK